MRATEDAPRDPFRFLERRHGLARLALKLRAVSGLSDVALDLPGEPAPAPAAGAALADFRRRVAAAAAQTAPSQADVDAEARRRAKEAKRERNRRIREAKARLRLTSSRSWLLLAFALLPTSGVAARRRTSPLAPLPRDRGAARRRTIKLELLLLHRPHPLAA